MIPLKNLSLYFLIGITFITRHLIYNPAYTYNFQLKTTKEYYDESYEEPDDYKNEYFEDYKVTRKEIDETYAADGARCSPEGKLTHNPNDCASFLVCNHKKYMVSKSK